MTYQKPEFYAQTAPQGSYSAACPPKERAPEPQLFFGGGDMCDRNPDYCLACERTM